MARFIELTLCSEGHKWNAIVNTEDVVRFTEGYNNLTLRTPFSNGNHDVTVVSEDVERLVQALLDTN